MKFCIYSNSDVFLKIHLVAYFGGWFHPCWWVSSVDITGLEFQPVRSGEVWRSLGCDPWHRQHGGARLHEGGNGAVLDAGPKDLGLKKHLEVSVLENGGTPSSHPSHWNLRNHHSAVKSEISEMEGLIFVTLNCVQWVERLNVFFLLLGST